MSVFRGVLLGGGQSDLRKQKGRNEEGDMEIDKDNPAMHYLLISQSHCNL